MNRNREGKGLDFLRARFRGARVGAIFALLAFVGGCATPVIAPQKPDTVIVLPGIGGDGDVYAQLVRSLYDYRSDDCLRVFGWGYSWPLFWITLSSSSLHQSTEQQLADQIVQWRMDHPGSHIALIAHSAGAGVVAGALARLPERIQIGPVILLAPSLSPDFDLRPALRHTDVIHVFFSADDDFWQGWGPRVFGTYDGAHRDAAGRVGFSLNQLNDLERARVIQHPYQSKWSDLGNYGGHFDWMAEPFVGLVLKPLIDEPMREGNLIASGKGQSSSAN